MPDTQQMLGWSGRTLIGADGAKLGTIEEIYVDDTTGTPEWALVNGGGMFGSTSTFVPLAEATDKGGEVAVPYTKATVKDAPKMESGQHLEQADEERLYQHYGLAYGDVGTVEGRQATEGAYGTDRSGTETDDAMTLSEERLRVGTEQREAGRARLRKHIVTEQVEVPVQVSREEVRLTREPITDANRDAAYAGPELSEEEHEVVLHEEVPVVDKSVIATERVRLDTTAVEGEVQVNEQVRAEQIELDEDGHHSQR
jgi:uncharacterized protein (TIGR02271 family)